jgi:hypothetical protein
VVAAFGPGLLAVAAVALPFVDEPVVEPAVALLESSEPVVALLESSEAVVVLVEDVADVPLPVVVVVLGVVDRPVCAL